jgi:glutamate-ammonia-ligase adenylyltransferase
MAANLIPPQARDEDSPLFHLKHSRGGMVDIEFMVQYGVLANAASYPELLRYTDNIRIIETFAEVGLVSEVICQQTIDAYQHLRAIGHALALKEPSSLVPLDDVKSYRDTVIDFWRILFTTE